MLKNSHLLDIILLPPSLLDPSTSLTEPLSTAKRTQSSEIIAPTFLSVLPRVISSVISPGHVHDYERTISRGASFSFARQALCVRRRALGDLPLPFAVLSHLSRAERKDGERQGAVYLPVTSERYDNGAAFRTVQIDFFFYLGNNTVHCSISYLQLTEFVT